MAATAGSPTPGRPRSRPRSWRRSPSLSPAVLPAPGADVSNRWADDDAAATLGQKLFFDPAFSGPLLEGDDDGSPGDARRSRADGQGRVRRLPRARGGLPRRPLDGEANLARRGMGQAPRALAARRGPGPAPHVGRSPRRALQPAVRAARIVGRDEQLAPLRRRADLRPLPSGLRGRLRADAAPRRHRALPGAVREPDRVPAGDGRRSDPVRRHRARDARRPRRVRRHDPRRPDGGHARRRQHGQGARRLRAQALVWSRALRRLDARPGRRAARRPSSVARRSSSGEGSASAATRARICPTRASTTWACSPPPWPSSSSTPTIPAPSPASPARSPIRSTSQGPSATATTDASPPRSPRR